MPPRRKKVEADLVDNLSAPAARRSSRAKKVGSEIVLTEPVSKKRPARAVPKSKEGDEAVEPARKKTKAAAAVKKEEGEDTKVKLEGMVEKTLAPAKVEASDFEVILERWSKANNLAKEIENAFPGVKVTINPAAPRRQSFEVTVKQGGDEKLVWTGIKKGPPRKLKFPEPVDVVEMIKAAI
ncbi:hypothetical protein BC937DRAFT_91329 [Endogone sp. FLAS-F59071]|nr:hypothetical protein BC937DRAFT_91329 [Endogone sp. FLAS-F59071]|eukprot:RUS16338.1 hypothetical protein BC937DRAFT_91329 [Endogone sp. FLAS-F59071]